MRLSGNGLSMPVMASGGMDRIAAEMSAAFGREISVVELRDMLVCIDNVFQLDRIAICDKQSDRLPTLATEPTRPE